MNRTGLEEAGEVNEGAGHFHVIADAGCVDVGDAITKDADHLHFGKGQTSGTIYLEPGSHELCLQVGDGVHEALDVTGTVTIEVGIGSQDESVRADVEETIAISLEFSEAIAEAADEAAAEAALATFYESSAGVSETAATWIADTCGVDINN